MWLSVVSTQRNKDGDMFSGGATGLWTYKCHIEEVVLDPYGIDDFVPGIEPEEDKHLGHDYQAPQSSQRLRRVALR